MSNEGTWETREVHLSPRGHLLAYQGRDPGVITVELYEKWYELWLTQEDGSVKAVSFLELEDTFQDDGASAFVDHRPNPRAVFDYAEDNHYRVDELSLELVVGRWHNLQPDVGYGEDIEDDEEDDTSQDWDSYRSF